jgi:hypothetical protein
VACKMKYKNIEYTLSRLFSSLSRSLVFMLVLRMHLLFTPSLIGHIFMGLNDLVLLSKFCPMED